MKRLFRTSFLAIAVLSLGMVACCNSKQNNETTATDEQPSVQNSCENVKWSHKKGDVGPDNWENLCSGFADCGGKRQSPINIDTELVEVKEDMPMPVFNYGKTKVDIINNGHTVQFNVSGKHTVNLEGKEYTLLQFHYHAKSEHTIDNQHYPLEVHFVHKHSDNEFAVLGILFVEGAENALLSKYLEHFPTQKGAYASEDEIDILALFPEDKSYYRYNGSLTTPPCSEIVNWYVLTTPVEASVEQIKSFAAILHNNYRPVLPVNEREVFINVNK